ncbi:MAG: hypothetical protein PGN09_02045 [Sphingomonas fennica]
MDMAIHLALAAVVRGLRRSGLLDERGIATIVSEMRSAAEEAATLLHDYDAGHLQQLAHEIAIEGGQPIALPPPALAASTLRIG